MQNFRALGAPPPEPRASGGWGLCPQTPSLRRLGVWGLRPQTPIGLRRLGAPPPDPQNSPLHCEFLATRLVPSESARLGQIADLIKELYILNRFTAWRFGVCSFISSEQRVFLYILYVSKLFYWKFKTHTKIANKNNSITKFTD